MTTDASHPSATSQTLQGALKRGLDVVGASAVLTLGAPVLAGLAVAVKVGMRPGPVFFSQRRPGLDEDLFTMLKFRTMRDTRGPDGELRPEGERLTPFGRWMRRYSLDELPQVFNILRGEMSLIGPRPLLTEYLERYPERFRKRHDVKPGVTGWAQVNGRHRLTFSERLEHDVWYVEHWSIWLDVKILAMTVKHLVVREDVLMPDQPLEEVDDLGLNRRTRPTGEGA